MGGAFNRKPCAADVWFRSVLCLSLHPPFPETRDDSRSRCRDAVESLAL
jgi:hypothetical protein